MFADQKKLVEWKNGMQAVLVEWKFQFLQWNFRCRMEVSIWKYGICRIAMDGPYWFL